MIRAEISSIITKTESPIIRQSACIACQNKNNCQVIASTIALLGSEKTLHRSSPAMRKKFALVADHLRREGFAYPYVRHPSKCWMHQKFGVATFYENQLVQLAEKMSQTERYLNDQPLLK